MSHALFKDGKQISKPHESKRAVLIEAYEAGAVVAIGAPDFREDFHDEMAGGAQLADGYDIREAKS